MSKLTSAIVLLVSVVLVLNEIRSSQAVGPRIGNSARFRLRHVLNNVKRSQQHHAHEPAAVDEDFEVMNRCILSCAKCSNGELDNNDESNPSQSRSLVCANECLNLSDTRDFVDALVKNNIFDKSFVKCFLEENFINQMD